MTPPEPRSSDCEKKESKSPCIPVSGLSDNAKNYLIALSGNEQPVGKVICETLNKAAQKTSTPPKPMTANEQSTVERGQD